MVDIPQVPTQESVTPEVAPVVAPSTLTTKLAGRSPTEAYVAKGSLDNMTIMDAAGMAQPLDIAGLTASVEGYGADVARVQLGIEEEQANMALLDKYRNRGNGLEQAQEKGRAMGSAALARGGNEGNG